MLQDVPGMCADIKGLYFNSHLETGHQQLKGEREKKNTCISDPTTALVECQFNKNWRKNG